MEHQNNSFFFPARPSSATQLSGALRTKPQFNEKLWFFSQIKIKSELEWNASYKMIGSTPCQGSESVVPLPYYLLESIFNHYWTAQTGFNSTSKLQLWFSKGHSHTEAASNPQPRDGETYPPINATSNQSAKNSCQPSINTQGQTLTLKYKFRSESLSLTAPSTDHLQTEEGPRVRIESYCFHLRTQ